MAYSLSLMAEQVGLISGGHCLNAEQLAERPELVHIVAVNQYLVEALYVPHIGHVI